jgi:aminopeptidase N
MRAAGSSLPAIVNPNASINTEYCSHGHGTLLKIQQQEFEKILKKRPYDVLSYQVFMDWTKPFLTPDSVLPAYTYSGYNRIVLRSDSNNLQKITLNAAFMQIDSVQVDSIMLNKSQFTSPVNQEFSISTPPMKAGSEHILKIWYTYNGNARSGFFYYPKGLFVRKFPGLDSNFVEEKIAYTMSQPQDARCWMPCNDAPYDKALSAITVRVPFYPELGEANISVSSNGYLRSIQEGINSQNLRYRDFNWYDTIPVSTYLMVASASVFTRFSDYFVSPQGDSIEIENYVWQKDFAGTKTDGSEYNARYSLGMAVGQMGAFIQKMGPYPFKKYGHTAVQPFNYGGMEHQTMSTVNRTWLRGTAGYGVAHELMHMWLGDYVTCATWADIWLNEGGATWGEALWGESWGGNQEYMNRMLLAKRNYLNENNRAEQPPIYGIEIERIFNYATTYAKASWVYHMLRRMCGDSAFFATLKSYMAEHAYSYAETADLLNTFQKIGPQQVPVPYDIFFDQWLKQAGHPVLRFASLREEQAANGKRFISYQINQVQNGSIAVPSAFYIPVSLSFYGKNGEKSKQQFIMNARQYNGDFTIDFPLDRIVINEEQDILCEADSASGVYAGLADQPGQISPNKADIYSMNDLDILRIYGFADHQTIQIYDIRGILQYQHTANMQPGAQQQIQLPKLQNGYYHIVVHSSQHSVSIPWIKHE